jgi:replication factor A2
MEIEGADGKKPQEDQYCRVWGRLKAFNSKRHVGAHVIRRIKDFNEVHYHLLQATATHLFFKHGPPMGAKGINGAGGIKSEGEGGEYNSGLPSMGPLARRVYNGLRDAKSNEGLHVQMLASVLGMQVNDVYKGAEELLATGVIFTTVDDETWAVLEV